MAKRQRKGTQNYLKKFASESDDSDDETPPNPRVEKLHLQPAESHGRGRYALQFFKDSDKEIAQMKQKARDPLVYADLNDREVTDQPFENFDFPIRPPWNYKMSKEELDRNENRYFTDYLQKFGEQHQEEGKHLGLFELNLESWRQLWRVLEISDIVLIIVDIRSPTYMFPPSLFTYIKSTLKKDVVLILNKIDLVRPEVVVAWKHYFLEKYPGISVALFASYQSRKANNMKVTKRGPNVKNNGECALELFKQVKSIVGSELNLTKWEEKIHEDIAASMLEMDVKTDQEVVVKPENYQLEEHVRYKNGILTIGCVGFPNVGKSSIINTLKGHKVVSVSRTPGHTKYFQTIYLTENVRLVDCPGLIFPSSTPRGLQVILGSYPIAQLRVPYESIRFVGERLDLPSVLSIQLPPDYSEWSPLAICDAWALRKGFLRAKTAHPDTYRAANNILQLVLQGRIVLDFFPPEFVENEDKWKNHLDIAEVEKIQNKESDNAGQLVHDYSSHSDNEDNKSESSDESSEEASKPATIPKSGNAFSLLDDESD